MAETKKPEQQEHESAPNEELSSEELDQVAGGEISFTFSQIEWTYTQQKQDGTAAAGPDGNKAAK
jgi:type VI protein secretion system component Hcp